MAMAIGLGIGLSFTRAAVGTVTYTPALKFNDARNSQYLPLLLRR